MITLAPALAARMMPLATSWSVPLPVASSTFSARMVAPGATPDIMSLALKAPAAMEAVAVPCPSSSR